MMTHSRKGQVSRIQTQDGMPGAGKGDAASQGAVDFLGIPEGGAAAVSSDSHRRISSGEAHKSIEGYFDRLVHHSQVEYHAHPQPKTNTSDHL